MMDKYRVHEVSKDLGMASKDIINLLGKYFPATPKKHMTCPHRGGTQFGVRLPYQNDCSSRL